MQRLFKNTPRCLVLKYDVGAQECETFFSHHASNPGAFIGYTPQAPSAGQVLSNREHLGLFSRNTLIQKSPGPKNAGTKHVAYG